MGFKGKEAAEQLNGTSTVTHHYMSVKVSSSSSKKHDLYQNTKYRNLLGGYPGEDLNF